MKDLNRARMMNQQNKIVFLQKAIESGEVTRENLLETCSKVYLGSKAFCIIQDFSENHWRTKNES